jgi:hypothetical protein
MVASLQRFIRRSPVERRLLAQALVRHAVVAARMRAGRTGDMRRSNEVTSAPASTTLTASGPTDRSLHERRVVWAVQTATLLLPFGRTCLTEALTAQWLLRSAGMPSTVCYGVAPAPRSRFKAHAWLESNGRSVMGLPADEPFFALEQVPAQPSA